MIRNITLTFLFFTFYINTALAHIDVVYPTEKKVKINANSTFFIGNTTKGANFSINGENVKLWDNNFFVKVVPLKYGKNKISLKSISKGKKEEITYEIYRDKPSTSSKKREIEFKPKDKDEVLYTKTIRENATIREKGTKASKRVIDLPQNVVLYLSGKKGDYYKIEETGETEYWIHKSNIQDPVNLSKKTNAKIKNTKSYEDNLYKYTKFYLSHPVLYTIKQQDKTLKLTLYGIEKETENGVISTNHEQIYTFENPILSYEGFYEENNFILKISQSPEITNVAFPLKDIKIFVDAGHGGIEKGAVGPTRVKEKDINLAISNHLSYLLRAEGADVINSRIDDRKVDLYERVKIAKNNGALISISIHNNSLPNGKDPYIKHGTEVHYYNENAKLLAQIIQDDLTKNLNLKDGGIHKSSFVLNRSTSPVSVLVEVAYMINPEEYIQLQKPEFQKKVANSIKNSIRKYIIIMTKEKVVL